MNRPTEVERFLATLPRVHPLRAPGVSEATVLAEIERRRQAAFMANMTAAIQSMLDRAAQAKGYDSILSAVSYKDSLVPRFAAEASAFKAWRDAVWEAATQQLAAVQAGQREAPASFAALQAELPQPPTFEA